MCKRKEKDTSIDCSGLSFVKHHKCSQLRATYTQTIASWRDAHFPALGSGYFYWLRALIGSLSALRHSVKTRGFQNRPGTTECHRQSQFPHCRMVMPETFVIFHNSDDTVRFLSSYCDKIPALLT